MNSQIKAWLIDLDGTLYHSKPVQLLMALELVTGGWSAWAIIRRFRASHESLRQAYADSKPLDSEKNSYEQQVELTAERLNISPSTVHVCVEKWMIQRPGKWLRIFQRRSLIQEISTFRRNGGKCALVSDYPARTKLQSMGIVDLFDVIVANGEPDGQRQLKPAPEGFLLAAERLGFTPDQCLVIGDRIDADGKAAERAKMQFRCIR